MFLVISSLSEEEKWCMYMKYRHEERAQPLIEELCRKEEGIMRAEQAVKWVSRDYEKAIRRMNIIKNDMDRNERSYDEGQTEAKREIARKMKEMGISLEQIHTITCLSLETIEQM
jgi:predicted transposase YdaD